MHAAACVVGGMGVGLSFRVTRMPTVGESVTADGWTQVNGGKAANQAIGISKLGLPAVLLSAVGDDGMRAGALAPLERYGVDTRRLLVSGSHPTMLGALVVDEGGENLIVIAPGALVDVDEEYVERNRTVVSASDLCLVSLEIPAAGARAALRVAREEGVLTLLNPAPAYAPEIMAPLVALADVITPNESEARWITGVDDPLRQVHELRRLGAGTVIVTLGAEGALVLEAGRSHPYRVPAVPVEAVDTSGAGDGFNAALAAALIRGEPVAAAVEFACAAAARIVQGPAFVEALHLWDGLATASPR